MKKPALFLALAVCALYGMYACTKENQVLTQERLSTLSKLSDSIPNDTLDTIPQDTLRDTVLLTSYRLYVRPHAFDSILWLNVSTKELFNYTYLTLPWAPEGAGPSLKLHVGQPVGVTPLVAYSRPAEFSYKYVNNQHGTHPFRINFRSINYTGQLYVNDSAFVISWAHDSIITISPKFIAR